MPQLNVDGSVSSCDIEIETDCEAIKCLAKNIPLGQNKIILLIPNLTNG